MTDDKPTRLLLVDDDPYADILKEGLDQFGKEIGYDTDLARSLEGAKDLLQSNQYFMVLMDVWFTEEASTGDVFLIDHEQLLRGASRVIFSAYAPPFIQRQEQLRKMGIPILRKGTPEFFADLRRNIKGELDKHKGRRRKVGTTNLDSTGQDRIAHLSHTPTAPAQPFKPDALRIFLCHSSEDKPAVRDLYHRLKNDHFVPWLDEEELIAGQEWEYEIRLAVRESSVVVVCLSRNSISKTGFIQKEIKFALDVADQRPQGSIFIIPLRLEPCEVPERLAKLQWIDTFKDGAYEKLIRSLQTLHHNK